MSDNPFTIGSVKVDSWGTGARNDCWWNIAKNQAGEGATPQEIAKLMNEIIAYNAEKKQANITKDTVVRDNEQIFIPLEEQIGQIGKQVEKTNGECTKLTTTMKTQSSDLAKLNTDVSTKLAAFQSIQSQFNNASTVGGEKGVLQPQLDSAKAEYLSALDKQKAKQGEVEKTKGELETKQKEIQTLKSDLEEAKKEYTDGKEDQKDKLAELDKQIKDLGDKVTQSQTELNAAKKEQENAQRQQEAAKKMGVEESDGKSTLKGEVSNEKINEASKNGRLVKKETIIDGGRTRLVEYADGSSEEFTRGSDGKFSTTPSVQHNAPTTEPAKPAEASVSPTSASNAYASADKRTEAINSATQAFTDAGVQSKYLEDLSKQIFAGSKTVNGATVGLTDAEKDELANQIVSSSNVLKDFQGSVTEGSTNYNKALGEYFGNDATYMTQMYTNKLDQKGKEEADKEMATYLKGVSETLKARDDAMSAYKEIKDNPTRLLLSNGELSTLNPDASMGSIGTNIGLYDGSQQYGLYNINTNIESFRERVDVIAEKTDAEAKISTKPKEEQDKIKELMSLYDSFMADDGAYTSSKGFFGNRPKEINTAKEVAEAVLMQKLGSGVSQYNIDDAIENLKNITSSSKY